MLTSKFLPNHGMPSAMMAKYQELREKPGWHLEFPYGAPKYGVVKYTNPPTLGYDGLTHRVFLFRAGQQETSLKILWIGDAFVRYNIAAVDEDGNGHSTFAGINTGQAKQTQPIDENVQPGDFYSLALRITEANYWQSYVNDSPGGKELNSWMFLHTEADKDWEWTLTASDDTVLSIHVCAEVGNFPRPGLYHSYEGMPPVEQPPGSTLFVEFIVKDPSVPITIAVGSKFSPLEYTNTSGLIELQKVSAFICNSPDFWTVSASFDPVPRKVYREGRDAQSNMVYLSRNCYIQRMNHIVQTAP